MLFGEEEFFVSLQTRHRIMYGASCKDLIVLGSLVTIRQTWLTKLPFVYGLILCRLTCEFHKQKALSDANFYGAL